MGLSCAPEIFQKRNEANFSDIPGVLVCLVDMPEPRNKTELQRILGTINYLRQFIPQASIISAPLRELLKKSTVWHWLPVHETALKTLKYKIASAPVLSVFNSSKSIPR
ncbi:hypothetical protein AVEN_189847-1 [Araneus ventricosus]|uniref:Uncharacterized protein n=1 Tax=Araneus ventricosus TaxID=182803 RepID=A0A4Y2EE47_ARAVE|nr:hypothetical protein AVEN_189847-1 [Araneus ventricosus]